MVGKHSCDRPWINSTQSDLLNTRSSRGAKLDSAVMWRMFSGFFYSFGFCHSKTTQRNKQIAMGRKKFNMDPKKVRGDPQLWSLNLNHSLKLSKIPICTALALSLKTGNPVSFGEWSSPEHPRGHCTVPLQRRRAQQNSHRGLFRGTVSSPVFSLFSFHLSFSSPHILVRCALHVLRHQW